MAAWKRRGDGAPYKATGSRLITPAPGRRGYRCYAGSNYIGSEWKPELVGIIAELPTAERWLRGENVGPALEQPTQVRRERSGLMARLLGR